MLAVAIIALVFSLLSLAWNAYTYFRPGRFDIRVTVRTEPVEVGGGSLELVVVATNHGTTTESVERIGLTFRDESSEEFPNLGAVSKAVDERLPPHANVRFRWDLGDQRFAVGGRYSGFARLATGVSVESDEGSFNAYSLHVAGLTDGVRPAPGPEEIQAAAPGRSKPADEP